MFVIHLKLTSSSEMYYYIPKLLRYYGFPNYTILDQVVQVSNQQGFLKINEYNKESK